MTDDDLRRVQALANTLSAMEIGQYRVKDGEGREITAESRAAMTIRLRNLIAGMVDADLLAAYERIMGEPGDPATEALLAELEQRRLEIR